MNYRLETIETIAQLQVAKSDWKQVCDRCLTTPQFLAYDWVEHSIQSFALKYIFFVIYNSDQPVALAGFVLDKKNYGPFSLPYLRLFGNLYSPRSEIIFNGDTESIKSLLAQQLQKLSWSHIEYGRTQDQIGFTQTNSQHWFSSIQHRKSFDIPSIDARISWDTFLANKSQNLRKNIKRLHKESNDIYIEHHNNTKADFKEIFTAIETCSAKTWKHNNGTSLAASPEAWKFFQSILESKSDDLKPLIILVKKESITIGFVFGTIFKRTLYAIKTGYDLDYEANSPGMLALTELMKYSCTSADIDSIDLDCVAGRGDYKYRFADTIHKVNDYYIFRKSISGRLLGFIYRLKTNIKKSHHE
jgi:Acetyltransferase (GNAT) domain